MDPSGGRLIPVRTSSHLADGQAVAAVAASAVASWGSASAVPGVARGAGAPPVVAARGTSLEGIPSAAIINRPFIISNSTRRSNCTPYTHIICRHHTANTAPRHHGTPPWISRWIFTRATCKYTYISLFAMIFRISRFVSFFLSFVDIYSMNVESRSICGIIRYYVTVLII